MGATAHSSCQQIVRLVERNLDVMERRCLSGEAREASVTRDERGGVGYVRTSRVGWDVHKPSGAGGTALAVFSCSTSCTVSAR